ncbi:beta-galactosidase trimerization domain-containing protein [Fredinandcohnia onubensis]|uniref:beta-galactosidase trimerization domain-containing protein n=1 Tax=Fredinandcohnia onubensis TaxID=1571209 RepID=UPI000C0C0FB2|nr:beta-galactosidase trimerization domain-containing protein [Fredinandcohnia onubensis]
MSELRNRQVHLDFHTSEYIPNVASEFVAEEFVETLKKANVNSITCFARCHHGWLYYPSKKHPELMHPNLENKNLLLKQIEICHKNDIKVPIYTTVQWDGYVMKHHPEWLCVDENGEFINSQNVPSPHFYYTICLNSEYRQFFKEHLQDIIEVVRPENIDGFFLDILFKVDCHCSNCFKQMKRKGLNTEIKRDRISYSLIMLDEFREEISALIKEKVPQATIFYNSSHIGPTQKKSLASFTHLELESLPSGGWGYDHFPATMRYSRGLGKNVVGMTGKFHTYWGDFHSLKNKAALEFECFNMLALGASCSIGDQLHPSGKLSEAAYDLIGHVYSKVAKVEEYVKDSKPVSEIGVFTPEEYYVPGDHNLGIHPSLIGTVRMLQELSYQFDIIDSKMDFEKYKLLILPDVIDFTPELKYKLKDYTQNGGKVIGTYESLIDKENKGSNFYGNQFLGNSEYDRDFVLPNATIGKNFYQEEYVMYGKAAKIESVESEVLMDTIKPYFNREGETFCSHQHAPSSRNLGYPAVTRKQNVIYFAHPIFKLYRKNSPYWCKEMVKDAIELLLDHKLVTHDGPSTLLTALNEKENEYKLLHFLHYITEKRSEDIYTIEDVIPLYNIEVKLLIGDRKVKTVKNIQKQEEIQYEVENEYIKFKIDKIEGHLMVLID